MKRLVFFWVEKYKEIDFMNHENRFLFENLGVDLSSKYHFEYKWDSDGRKLYDLNVFLNKDLIEYSDKIQDLKVFVGKNGTGKSSLLKLIGNIVSGNNLNMISSYVVVWEEKDELFYYAKGCECLCNYKQIKNLPFFKTIIYSSDFSRYHDELVRTGNLINMRKNYLMRTRHNDSINRFCLEEENVLIDFLIDFSKIKDDIGDSFLWKMINIPPRLIFTFDDTSIGRKIEQLLENKKFEGKEYFNSLSLTVLRNRVKNFFEKMLLVAWLGVCEKECNDTKDIFAGSIAEYMQKTYPTVYENVAKLMEVANLGKVYFENDVQVDAVMYNLENNYEQVFKFREYLRRINPYFIFMPVTIDFPMSAGEYEYMQFFSRFWNVIKKSKNPTEVSNYLLILDEVDRGLHPEWQRIWFTKFLESLDAMSDSFGIKLNLQLFIATHSPFMLSDFADESILKMKRIQEKSGFFSNVKCDYNPTRCFGGNIYDIMKDGFFLESSIGGFVENQITKIINDMKKCKEENRPLSIDYSFVNRIGNPILKSLLLQKIKSAERNK
ncbi:AAA family ATPase [uncultured Fibrobacter sp.]|uniref:AAA family ATPase n=1 Tax=uncultured Fibrobacter sp. TaxID=261512 RepID=UPI002627F306|nr:AAA family ATPase [uncultured Fibrobacter sp.]